MGPLAGVKVVEIGQVLAGPYAGAIFADLGAEVIKVEKPDGGDDARQMGRPFRHGDALNFHEFNRGKKSVTLDLKSAAGVEALHALLQHADILIHNMRPGVAESTRASGRRRPTARHPRLIYCAMGGLRASRAADRPAGLRAAAAGLSAGCPPSPASRTGRRCGWGPPSWTRARGCGR